MIKTCYVDTNIFLYLADNQSPFFNSCISFINYCKNNSIQILTSTETFQEIIYLAQNTKQFPEGIKTVNLILEIINDIVSVDKTLIMLYLELVKNYKNIRSRGVLHLAASISCLADVAISYDKDFKKFKEIKSKTPEEFLKKK